MNERAVIRDVAWLVLAVLVLAVWLSGCTGRQVVQTAQIAGALAEADAQYVQVRDAAVRRIPQMPSEQAAVWTGLVDDAEALREAARVAWEAVPTPGDLDALYAAGAALYAKARPVVEAELAKLPVSEQLTLRRLDASLQSLAKLYGAWREDPDGRQRAELIAGGLEVAKNVLKIAMVAL